MATDFQQEHWYLKDLQYEYLDDGYKLVATTDVPCHLFCRMTTTPPRKHALPSYRRGLFLQGDIRFCFVVYEDNEQDEPGDTLIHTWHKTGWPVCETRWFYFVGTIAGAPVVSESPIFTFHFPGPPPEPPVPIEKTLFGTVANRTIRSNHILWPACWGGSARTIMPWHGAPDYELSAQAALTVSFWCLRSWLYFPPLSLPATAQIVNAQFRFYPTFKQKTSSFANPHIYLQRSFWGPPVYIGMWGFQNSQTDSLGQIHLDDIILNQYNDIELNAAGIAFLENTAVNRFCVRTELDVKNISPPLGNNRANYHSEQKGAGYRPQLRIRYYPV